MKTFISLIFLSFMFFSFGQNNYESQYDYTNVGLGKTIPVKHIFNPNESISIFNFQRENNLTQDESGELSFKISLNDSIGNHYYNRSDKLIFRDVVFNSGKEYVIVEDDLPDFKWQISKETKQIGPYQCLKATGSFRGRTRRRHDRYPHCESGLFRVWQRPLTSGFCQHAFADWQYDKQRAGHGACRRPYG